MDMYDAVSYTHLVVALALKGGGNTVTETLYEEPPLTVTQTSAETSAPAVETQSTVCYYQDGDGYLVPVTRQVEKPVSYTHLDVYKRQIFP